MRPSPVTPSAVGLCFALALAAANGCSAGGGEGFGPPPDDAALPDASSTPDARAEAAPIVDASHDASTPDVAAPTPDASDAAGPDMLDLHQATIFDNPANLADWPVTTLITDVEFQYQGMDGIHVEFSKRDGAGSWPDVTPPGWNGPLEYTLGMAEFIGGKWYASAAIQLWRGLPAAGGNVASDIVTTQQCTSFGLGSSCQVAKNWYYDGRWGNLQGYQPATGEVIGIFVVAGNVRGVVDGSQSPVQERSNVVLVPMPTFAGAKYTF